MEQNTQFHELASQLSVLFIQRQVSDVGFKPRHIALRSERSLLIKLIYYLPQTSNQSTVLTKGFAIVRNVHFSCSVKQFSVKINIDGIGLKLSRLVNLSEERINYDSSSMFSNIR